LVGCSRRATGWGLSTLAPNTTVLEGSSTMERRKVRPTVMVVLGMKSILDMMTAVAAAPSLPSSSTLVAGLGRRRGWRAFLT